MASTILILLNTTINVSKKEYEAQGVNTKRFAIVLSVIFGITAIIDFYNLAPEAIVWVSWGTTGFGIFANGLVFFAKRRRN